MLLHPWWNEKCIYRPQTWWLIAQVCYHRQLKLHSYFFKTLPENLRSHVIRCCSHVIRCHVWPLHSPDLTLVTFIFGYIWKMKYIKHILMFWKNWETASALRFLQFLGKIFRVNNVLDQSIDCIRSGKEHFLHPLQLWWVFIGLSTGCWIFFSPSSPTVKPHETWHIS
jgi:hypothetical protein